MGLSNNLQAAQFPPIVVLGYSTNTMKKITFLFPAIISLTLFGAGCSVFQTVNVNTSANVNATVTTNTSVGTSISYQGQDGKNALALLEAAHSIDVSAAGFVNAIDGIKPGDHQYWALYVNGVLASVGAKDLQTKSTDMIEWKLESF